MTATEHPDRPPCGATREEPGPFEFALLSRPDRGPDLRPTCYFCAKNWQRGGKCSVITFDGEVVTA
jgi:hypothetical protein